ncbi:MAG: proline--tRNA ligase [Nanoarchaeota archaeon]|nr:proline--tRNA ligase [Nanoarchaeota archaeon]
MAENEMGLTVKKDEDFSEWYTQILQKADLSDIRFGIQGFIVQKPWAYMIIRKIYDLLEKEVEMQGHLPYRFPTAVKEKDLMKEEEHAGFTPEVFWVSEAGDKKIEERFALRPTGEAQIYPMYSLWFRSHRDLPFLAYQSRNSVFRNEMTTRPFIRGREFMFFESHNAYNEHQEALDQIKKDLETCDEVIGKKAKIPFYYFKRPQWDKFLGADDTFTPDTVMPDGKRNQLGSTHDLGTNFAKAYDIKVRAKDGKQQLVYQTCFGPGIWRIFAAMVGIHGDDNGLIIPFDFAPVQVVIVPIIFSKKKELTEKVLTMCKKLETDIRQMGYKVKLDDRDYESPGAKYNHWELKGVPMRLEVGPKEVDEKVVSLKLRTGGNKEKVKVSDLKKVISSKAKELDKEIEVRAQKYFKGNVREASDLKDLVKIMKEHRGFIKVPFCSVEMDGEKCEEEMKAETQGGRVCGTLYPKEDKVAKGQKCIVCKKTAKHMVYIAKSY